MNSDQPPPIRRDGRDWALPPELINRHGTAVVRTIRVYCDYDKFVLPATRQGQPQQVFRITNGNTNRAVLEMAAAIRARIATWGATLPGGRWEPTLEVQIAPYGQTRFNELRMLMNGSGIEVQAARTSSTARKTGANTGVTR